MYIYVIEQSRGLVGKPYLYRLGKISTSCVYKSFKFNKSVQFELKRTL